jgi:hypothetical protein
VWLGAKLVPWQLLGIMLLSWLRHKVDAVVTATSRFNTLMLSCCSTTSSVERVIPSTFLVELAYVILGLDYPRRELQTRAVAIKCRVVRLKYQVSLKSWSSCLMPSLESCRASLKQVACQGNTDSSLQLWLRDFLFKM